MKRKPRAKHRFDVGTTTCPRCGQHTPVRLSSGQVCASCRSADAWSERDHLVITHGDIAAAESRRSLAPRVALTPLFLSVAAVALAVVAGLHLLSLFDAQPVRGLDELVGALRGAAMNATLWGAASLIGGIGALVYLRRSRHAHRRHYLVTYLVAVFAGGSAAVTGGLHWYGVAGSLGLEHLTMPAFARTDYPSVHFERIAAATVVIVVPAHDGDAKNPGIGTGAIIGRDSERAWIVTCSHVAMPYASVASWRDPADAMPVWVQLYDGRSAQGTITWAAPPPLDVAVVEVPMENTPAPIEISRTTDALEAGAPVMFVPNPYRHGWMIHHGEIEKRRLHNTPAGPYSLVYTTLPVQPGDSGSGLFDSRGLLIGLNTWARFGAGGPRGISLPSETLHALVDAVRDNRLHELDKILPAHPGQPDPEQPDPGPPDPEQPDPEQR